jgi:hypothetical protein
VEGKRNQVRKETMCSNRHSISALEKYIYRLILNQFSWIGKASTYQTKENEGSDSEKEQKGICLCEWKKTIDEMLINILGPNFK